jgi:hypothetical protein
MALLIVELDLGGYMTNISNKHTTGPQIVSVGTAVIWKMDGGWHRYYGPAVNNTNSWWIHNKRVKIK